MTGAACRCEIEKNSGIMYDPRVASAALAHWDTLISRYAADTPRTPYFDRLMLERTRQAHDYLVAHQDSRITLAELAAKFHLSQSSLKLCFKALYGAPVAGYLRTVRMDTAARLLQESDLPVAEIAHRVGYEDPSRFSAAFRRHTGRRPTELRRVACPCAE
jgi:AraC-like DNA-binding protein